MVCGLDLVGAESGAGVGEIEQDDVGAGGGEDGGMMVAEQTRAAGDDGEECDLAGLMDAAGEIEEGVGAIREGRHG